MPQTYDGYNNVYVDPVTGQPYNATNHTYYNPSDPYMGAIGSADPGEQSIANEGRANRLLTQGFADQSLIATPYAGLGQLGQNINQTLVNPNAPSVAQAQQTGAFDQLNRTQLAGAAGVGGNNSAAARRAAMLNIGNTGSELAQRQATLRAQEVANAQGKLGEVLGKQAEIGLNQRSQDLGAAGQYAHESNAASGVVSDLNQKDRTANKELYAGMVKGASAGIGAAFGA